MKTLLVPVPSEEFWWEQSDDDDIFTLHRVDEFTGIYISPYQSGDFGVVLGYYTLPSVPTMRMAQAIAHTIAWAFQDSLQSRRGLVNDNRGALNFQGRVYYAVEAGANGRIRTVDLRFTKCETHILRYHLMCRPVVCSAVR